MDDKDKTELTGTFDSDFHLTSKNRLLMEEIIDSSTVIRQYQPVELHASWVQRLLNWIRED